MRFGISWDPAGPTALQDAWRSQVAEAVAADGVGLDSLWIHHEREGDNALSAPSAALAYLSSKTRSIQLRMGLRQADRGSPVRIAEEVAIVDLFSRGRVGLCLAGPARQDVALSQVQELVALTAAAWQFDDFRFRGEHTRFPAHTPDEAPPGVSLPSPEEEWRPQWEWGPATPDYLAVTPKPAQVAPAMHVELDRAVLRWLAEAGISPFVPADVPTDEALRLLTDYQEVRRGSPAVTAPVEPVLERRVALGGTTDDHTFGGTPVEIADQIRRAGRQAGVRHFVWRRTAAQRGRSDQLFTAAAEIQPLVQA